MTFFFEITNTFIFYIFSIYVYFVQKCVKKDFENIFEELVILKKSLMEDVVNSIRIRDNFIIRTFTFRNQHPVNDITPRGTEPQCIKYQPNLVNQGHARGYGRSPFFVIKICHSLKVFS